MSYQAKNIIPFNEDEVSKADLENYAFGQVMPQNVPAEKAILGALMIDKESIYIVLPILKELDFYEPKHKVIFKAINELHSNMSAIDLLTVTDKITSYNLLQEIGGAFYLVDLTNKVASAANIEYHCRIVKQESVRRQLIESSVKINADAYDVTVDCFDALEKSASRLQKIYDQVDKSKAEDKNTIAHRVRNRALNPPEDGISGLRFFGIDSLDYKFGGLQKGELIIIAGRPSMGKSTLANTGFVNVGIHQNEPILYWSLEGSNDETLHRAACALSDVDGSKIMKGTANDEELQRYIEATKKIESSNCFFEDTSGVSASDIRMTLTSRVRQDGIKAVILDHGGHIKYEGKDSKNNKIGDALKIIIQAAKELSIPVVLIWQLSRGVESRGGAKRPSMSDLRDSGELEQDAHVIALVYRSEYYGILEDEEGNSLKGIGEVIIAKNKNMGMSDVKLKVNLPSFKFLELDKKEEEWFDDFNELTDAKQPTSKPSMTIDKRPDTDDIPF